MVILKMSFFFDGSKRIESELKEKNSYLKCTKRRDENCIFI